MIPAAEHQRRREVVWGFVFAAVSGDRAAYVASLDALDWPDAWPAVFREIVAIGYVPDETRRTFADQWSGGQLEGVAAPPPAGKRLRAIFASDVDLFVDGLRILLPPLQGAAPEAIFRGQSAKEHQLGLVGFSWSPYPMLAELYARDPDFSEGEAVVLASFFPTEAIIGEVNFGELIVDPRRIRDPVVVLRSAEKFYPPKEGEASIQQCDTLPLFSIIPNETLIKANPFVIRYHELARAALS